MHQAKPFPHLSFRTSYVKHGRGSGSSVESESCGTVRVIEVVPTCYEPTLSLVVGKTFA